MAPGLRLLVVVVVHYTRHLDSFDGSQRPTQENN